MWPPHPKLKRPSRRPSRIPELRVAPGRNQIKKRLQSNLLWPGIEQTRIPDSRRVTSGATLRQPIGDVGRSLLPAGERSNRIVGEYSSATPLGGRTTPI